MFLSPVPTESSTPPETSGNEEPLSTFLPAFWASKLLPQWPSKLCVQHSKTSPARGFIPFHIAPAIQFKCLKNALSSFSRGSYLLVAVFCVNDFPWRCDNIPQLCDGGDERFPSTPSLRRSISVGEAWRRWQAVVMWRPQSESKGDGCWYTGSLILFLCSLGFQLVALCHLCLRRPIPIQSRKAVIYESRDLTPRRLCQIGSRYKLSHILY